MPYRFLLKVCFLTLLFIVTVFSFINSSDDETISELEKDSVSEVRKIERLKVDKAKSDQMISPSHSEPKFHYLTPSYVNERYTDDLIKLKQRKIIRALVVPGRTDFYIENGHVSGLIVELLDNYEKELNRGIEKEEQKTRIVYVPVNFGDLIPYLLEGKGDIAAGFLTITDDRKKLVDFASGQSRNINELIIINRDSDVKVSTLDDLAGKNIYVVKGSSYIEHLHKLNVKLINKDLKEVNIVETESHISSEDILEMLNAGVIDITVVDDFRADLWAKILPNILVRDDLVVNSSGSIGWATRKNNPELKNHLEVFSKKVKKGTLLGNTLFNRYYGRDQKLENLKQHKESKQYKKLIKLFKKYGEKYEINHLQLIAQAYQESGLRQDLTSHRGAVGVMQLLPSTATDKNVAIKNIELLENNIHAGTKYMSFLKSHYFSSPDIAPEDQMFFSWAAYNAGPTTVRKMRNHAEKMGLDKNVWFKNVEIAAARLIGTETVRYVANIYKYYSTYLLLNQKEAIK